MPQRRGVRQARRHRRVLRQPFGHDVRWRYGFPFSWFRHPQYVGTVATIWGVFLALRWPHPDWIVLPLIETAYYVAGAWLEDDATPPPSSALMRRVLQERLPHPQARALDDARHGLQAGRREHDDRRAVVEVAQLLTAAERRVAADAADSADPAAPRQPREVQVHAADEDRADRHQHQRSAPPSSAMGMITRSLRQ